MSVFVHVLPWRFDLGEVSENVREGKASDDAQGPSCRLHHGRGPDTTSRNPPQQRQCRPFPRDTMYMYEDEDLQLGSEHVGGEDSDEDSQLAKRATIILLILFQVCLLLFHFVAWLAIIFSNLESGSTQ